jgi:hypothetical protein
MHEDKAMKKNDQRVSVIEELICVSEEKKFTGENSLFVWTKNKKNVDVLKNILILL